MKTIEIGKSIAQRRKQLGLSQEELAQQLHVTRQAVSKWESGMALPSVDNIVELAGILSISVDELLQLPHEDREPALSAQSVGLLLDEQSLRYDRRIRRLTVLLIIAVAVLVAGITLSTVLNVQRTSRMEDSVQMQNQQILSTIAGIEGDLASTVQSALSTSSTLLADSGCRAYDYTKDQTLLMRFFAYPQTLHNPSNASFYALLPDGSRISTPAEQTASGFEGTLIIPDNQEASMPLSVYVSWTEGDETLTEKIFDEHLYLDDLRLRINYLIFNSHYLSKSNSTMEVEPILEVSVPASLPFRHPVSVHWEFFIKGRLAWSTDTPVQCEEGTCLMTLRPAEERIYLDAKHFDDVTLRVTVADASGATFVRTVDAAARVIDEGI